MNTFVAGAISGFLATVPMTAAMLGMHRWLPGDDRTRLPPEEITTAAGQATGRGRWVVEEDERIGWTLVSHFGYGAASGALYAPLARRIPLPRVLGGIVFALGVWAVSYLGWVPATGLMPPATQDTGRRNTLMIASHVVWGAATALLVDRLDRRSGISRR